eukprot:CAMPEP_0172835446 /NCGR_PEP_ID=MMETSP1075-20121228/25769_1 /TAXON_ID=2916 /ORGANISM="Ceratium fusus, Strain PA161109" /LENGTH=576 /DNA_ID=CAMNT_0013678489 /DNA_START=21 /DNA_END=1751 /DNA_ORIENTATION=-
MSCEAFAGRGSPQGTSHYSFNRSSAMRRSSSAASVGPRSNTPSACKTAPISFSAPRRRCESTLPAYATPARGRFQHKANASQLESKLTERLREHSRSSFEATRRMAPAVDRRPKSNWLQDEYSIAHHGHANGGRVGGMWADRRGMPPVSIPPPTSQAAWTEALSAPYSNSYTAGVDRAVFPQTDAVAPESHLKIYSDLFEEVIERDRVFGPLLRKIKTEYDMLLVRDSEQILSMPPSTMPMCSSGLAPSCNTDDPWGPLDVTHSSTMGRRCGGLHSNEPTSRAEDGLQSWEMQRENHVLKDLVERLDLELEEAVKREHRWKQKVAKMRAVRNDQSALGVGPSMPQACMPSLQTATCFPTQQDSLTAGYQDRMQAVQSQVPPEEPLQASSTSPSRTFAASRREPTGAPEPQEAEPAQDPALNQGGLLSISSISPQASGNPAPDSMECMLNSCDTARSADSGMLPQRPTRRHIIKPQIVPSLDLTCVQQQLEEEQDDEEQGDRAEEGLDEEYAAGFARAGSDEGPVNLCDTAGGGSYSCSRSPRAAEHHFQDYGRQGDAGEQHHRDLYWEPAVAGDRD